MSKRPSFQQRKDSLSPAAREVLAGSEAPRRQGAKSPSRQVSESPRRKEAPVKPRKLSIYLTTKAEEALMLEQIQRRKSGIAPSEATLSVLVEEAILHKYGR